MIRDIAELESEDDIAGVSSYIGGAVEIFETSDPEWQGNEGNDNDDNKSSDSRSISSFGSAFDDSGDRKDDAVQISKAALPSAAEETQRFAASGVITGAWSDLSDAISQVSRKGYRTYYSTAGIESRAEKIARIKREIQELVDSEEVEKKDLVAEEHSELQKLKSHIESMFSHSTLSAELEAFKSSTEHRSVDNQNKKPTIKGVKTDGRSSEKDNDSIQGIPHEKLDLSQHGESRDLLLDLYALESRISRLEQELVAGVPSGSANTSCEVDNTGSAASWKPIKHKLYSIAEQVAVLQKRPDQVEVADDHLSRLYQRALEFTGRQPQIPSDTHPQDQLQSISVAKRAVSSGTASLASLASQVQSSAAVESPMADLDREEELQRARTIASKVDALFPLVDKVHELEPLVSLVLERFKRLDILHQDASTRLELLKGFQESQEILRNGIAQWKEVLEQCEHAINEKLAG